MQETVNLPRASARIVHSRAGAVLSDETTHNVITTAGRDHQHHGGWPGPVLGGVVAVTGRGAFPLRSGLGGFSRPQTLYRPGAARAVYADYFFVASSAAYTADVNETVALTEAALAAWATTAALAELLALSDATAAITSAVVGVTDSVGLSETVHGLIPVGNPSTPRRRVVRRRFQ